MCSSRNAFELSLQKFSHKNEKESEGYHPLAFTFLLLCTTLGRISKEIVNSRRFLRKGAAKMHINKK